MLAERRHLIDVQQRRADRLHIAAALAAHPAAAAILAAALLATAIRIDASGSVPSAMLRQLRRRAAAGV